MPSESDVSPSSQKQVDAAPPVPATAISTSAPPTTTVALRPRLAAQTTWIWIGGLVAGTIVSVAWSLMPLAELKQQLITGASLGSTPNPMAERLAPIKPELWQRRVRVPLRDAPPVAIVTAPAAPSRLRLLAIRGFPIDPVAVIDAQDDDAPLALKAGADERGVAVLSISSATVAVREAGRIIILGFDP